MSIFSYKVKKLKTFSRTRELHSIIQIFSSKFYGYHEIVMSKKMLIAAENAGKYIHTVHVRWCIHSTFYIITHNEDIITIAFVFQATNRALFVRFHTSHRQWKYCITSWSPYNQLQYLPKFDTSNYLVKIGTNTKKLS